MKYLKRFNESINEIDAICQKYNIENYIINNDGSIDVGGNVDLINKGLTKLPIKFRNVTGYFNCYSNQLTTLEGAPNNVGFSFICSFNRLETLKGCPQIIGGDFDCSINQLTNLEYCPKRVGDDFISNINNIKNINYIPYIGGHKIDISDNPIFFILDLFIKMSNDDENDYINNITNNMDLIHDFINREIIEEDILIMDRLIEFLEDVGKPQPKEYLQTVY